MIDRLALLSACQTLIETRRQAARQAMAAAQEAANQEEKSSAGDKYETGRAMAQNDRDRAARQLAEADGLLNQLRRIQEAPAPAGPEARLRSIVRTDRGDYLLGLGLGRVLEGERPFFALSLAAPAARPLLNCKAGDRVAVPGGTALVMEIG